MKPKNILLKCATNGPPFVKITDFGLSKVIENDTILKTRCGTEYYMAPEVYKEKSPYTNKVDCWSLGLILFKLLTGKLLQLTDFKITKENIDWERTADGPKKLIKRLLRANPITRMGVKEILSHDWMNDNFMISCYQKLTQNIDHDDNANYMSISYGCDDNAENQDCEMLSV